MTRDLQKPSLRVQKQPPTESPGIIEKKLQEKTQENPYFTLNYKENSGFPGFFPGVFFQEGSFSIGVSVRCFLCCLRWEGAQGEYVKKEVQQWYAATVVAVEAGSQG